MNRVIGVLSGKGGVGKTTVAVNLAGALMGFNKNTLLVDADIKMSGLGLQIGMYYFPVTLNDVLNSEANILEALYVHSSGLRIIPASVCAQDADISRFGEILSNPLLENNVILMDCPPGLEDNVTSLLDFCQEAIIVTTPDIPAITDVVRTLSAIEKTKVRPIGVIVNRFRKNDSEQLTISEIEDVCGLPIIGVIHEDDEIRKSVFQRVPNIFTHPDSRNSNEFKKIAASLCGLAYEPRQGLLKRLFRRSEK